MLQLLLLTCLLAVHLGGRMEAETAIISEEQASFAMGFPNVMEFRRACERGRLMAAASVASDPVKRAEMEARFGVERCRQRWPEAYQGR